MFTPSQLEQLPIEVEKHFRKLEIRVMSDIIRRIKMNAEITRTADYQLHRMSQLGAGSEEIKKSLEKALKSSGLHVDTIYDEVIAAGYAYDEKLYKAVGVKQTPFTENEELQQLIFAVKTQTNDELKNITGSLGFAKLVDGKRVFEPIADYYQKTLDTAFYDISTGLFDYNSVIKRVVQEMTTSGLRSVTYETGWSNRVDVAARRAIMTGVNQVTAHISDKNAEELGTEYFEVSWHGTARPSHQEWQGKVYTKQELIEICGLGSVEGLCGSNCRHSYYAYIPGVSERVYTDEELELLNAKENLPHSYNGKEYTAYEATQHQRKLETLMRKQRQDIKLYKEAGVSEEIVIAAQSRYRATMHEYVKFSKEMDLPQQMQRVYVDGLKDIGGHGKLKTIKKPAISPQKPAIEETFKTYTGSQLDKMSLEQLRKLAEDTAVKYYDSGISGISFGGTSHKDAAALLAAQGSKTSLKKDILSMQKKLQKQSPAAKAAKRNTDTDVFFNENAEYKVFDDTYSPKVNDAMSASCKNVAKLGSETRVEHLNLLDLDTGDIVYTEIGDAVSVGHDAYREFLNSHTGNHLAFIHSHVTDGWISQTDMQTLLTSKYIDVMIAVRNDGVIYYASKTSGVKINKPAELLYSDDILKLRKECEKDSSREFIKEYEKLLVSNLIRDYCKEYKEYGKQN